MDKLIFASTVVSLGLCSGVMAQKSETSNTKEALTPQDRLSAYDADGDGVLSLGEKKAARAEFLARRKARRAEMLAKYDANGDGVLSASERKAAREAGSNDATERLDSDSSAADGNSSADNDEVTSDDAIKNAEMADGAANRWAKQADLNGDGVLSDEERQMARQKVREHFAEQRELLQDQFDLDGDGELSEDERMTMKESMRARADQLKEKFTKEFDRDGDGQLNDHERREAGRAAHEEYTKKYDADGDGEFSNEERNRMLNDFLRGKENEE